MQSPVFAGIGQRDSTISYSKRSISIDFEVAQQRLLDFSVGVTRQRIATDRN
jgi:hypothetical protein